LWVGWEVRPEPTDPDERAALLEAAERVLADEQESAWWRSGFDDLAPLQAMSSAPLTAKRRQPGASARAHISSKWTRPESAPWLAFRSPGHGNIT
jgi:hypothetical protein